jgi:hypothetical protein
VPKQRLNGVELQCAGTKNAMLRGGVVRRQHYGEGGVKLNQMRVLNVTIGGEKEYA